MGMPALPGAGPVSEFGGNNGGANAAPPPTSPASAQPDSPALSVLNDINNISRSARNIGDNFPTTGPIIDQINQLVSQLQLKIVQALPPTPVQAPPV
jgi:hypothetical protein